jgi:hypothetical protein
MGRHFTLMLASVSSLKKQQAHFEWLLSLQFIKLATCSVTDRKAYL